MDQKVDNTIESLLPSGELDKKAMSEIYSDHLPKIYPVQLSKENSINVLSYNTLSGWVFQGFESQELESIEQEKLRHIRITSFIKEAVKDDKIGIISLQETTTLLAEQIKNKLGEEWVLAVKDDNRAILYRNSQFNFQSDDITPTKITNNSEDIRNNDFKGAKLKHYASDKTIAVFSAHVPHSASPTLCEKAVMQIREEFSDNDLVLFACDFNRQIAHSGAGLIDNANNLIPSNFRQDNQHYDFTDGCFGFHKDDNTITQYNGFTPRPSSPKETIERNTISEGEHPYFPVMFGSGHLLPVVGAEGKSLSVHELETALRNKTKQDANDLRIEVYATRYNKKKIIIHSKKEIPEFNTVGIEHNVGTYTLQFDYKPLLEDQNAVGLQIVNRNETVIIPLSSLVPSPSLTFKICAGVIASLVGTAALIIGALAVAAVLTAIAPPIGIAMIALGAAALLTGVGLFGKSALLHKKYKEQANRSVEDMLEADPSLMVQNNK